MTTTSSPPPSKATRPDHPAAGQVLLTDAVHGAREAVSRYWPTLVLAVLIVIFSITSSAFLTRINWLSTSVYAAQLVPLAIGEMLVMVIAGIDLSIAGTAYFTAMCAALIIQPFGPNSILAAVIAGIACVGIGSVIGAVNGLLVAKARLAPFIVTLGMLEVLTGGVNLLNNGLSQSVTSNALNTFGNGVLWRWVSPLVIAAAALLVVFSVILARTRFGLRAYAIGSNGEAVRKLGVPTTRIICTQYILSGAMGGISGLFLVAQFNEATTAVDTSAELTAIAAVVIGGTSLFGGSGTVFGTFTGVAIVSVLLPGLVLSGLATFWQTVVTGIVIIAAVSIEQLRHRDMSGLLRNLSRFIRVGDRT